MSTFFNKIVKSNGNFTSINFMKHKLVFMLIPIIALITLAAVFAFNFYVDKYDIDAITEKTKTVINIPIDDDVNPSNYTLNKIQNFASSILKSKCSAYILDEYREFPDFFLRKNVLKELEISGYHKDEELEDDEVENLFNKLKEQFPNVVTCDDFDNVMFFNTVNSKNNFKFWMQIVIASSIILLILLLCFSFSFKQIGFFATNLVTINSLILSLGTTFLTITMLTKKINLTFMVAMSIYFIVNLSILFFEIKKELLSNSDQQQNSFIIANTAINKTFIPHALATILILVVTSLASLCFGALFNNYILFYFFISATIGITIDLFMNTFYNGQLWAMLMQKKLKKSSATN